MRQEQQERVITLFKKPGIYCVLIGAICALILYSLHTFYLYSSRQYSEFWFQFCYPVIVFLSFFLGFAVPQKPWRWPLLMMISSYVGELFLLPGTGELLFLEVALLAVLMIPCVILAYFGAYIRNRKMRKAEL